jgi:pyruvate-ferredoxin/flavodoxin oxidoreductase
MKDNRKSAAMDGNEAAAHVAYAFTEVAAIYPITPSSPMAEKTDEWSALGRKNIFGQPVRLIEMQSEAGAAGAVHGAIEAGALSTSYTSSQGLMLMIPTMLRLSGTRQPAVLHVASRTVGTHAMSIFGDHSDVMNCRGTGFAMISSGSVQEVMDLSGVAHLSAIRGRIPFMHFFDGFRTSHEIQKIKVFGYDTLAKLVDYRALEEWRDRALNPDHPTLRCTVQNPDVYFQVRESNNRFYDELPGIVEGYLNDINALTGESYGLFNYYGAPDAERIIIAMGSVSGTIRDTVEYLNSKGERTGYLQVHLFRPFSVRHFISAMPSTVKRIAVLDRCKEHGAPGEPLYMDVCSAFFGKSSAPLVVGGRYGLASKDTDPAQIKAVFDNLAASEPRNGFTIGISDDVTGLSLPVREKLDIGSGDTVACKFWGLGSDGTVGANKNSIKIISDRTEMYTQAYFEYDTKKSFGITKSHLRFGKKPILSTHLVKHADFVACHKQSYLDKYDIVSEIKAGGTFLLNCSWNEDELSGKLPASVKRIIAERNISLYIIDAAKIARGLGLGGFTNMVLQSAFFGLAKIIPIEEAMGYMKDAIRKTYAKKGDRIINMNMAAVDAGAGSVRRVDVPADWAHTAEEKAAAERPMPDFIRNIMLPLNSLKGDEVPVSGFIGYEDGTMPLGTSAWEKRGIATELPVWDPEKCSQCNLCSYVCAHGVIRPYLLDEREAAGAPEGFAMAEAKGRAAAGHKYSLQFSSMDCTACGVCAAECPVKEKAIVMKPAPEVNYSRECWEYGLTIKQKDDIFPVNSVKGSQFRQPLLEFSGACAGCGETPYAKLMTQLFGDHVYWANATGCSQAWASAMPCVPYTVNSEGEGPAWSNSLFENNAEFSLGMALASQQTRRRMKEQVGDLIPLLEKGSGAAEAAGAWLKAFDDFNESKNTGRALVSALRSAKLKGRAGELAEAVIRRSDQLSKKTIWMYGGDGWAYDIGYGGLDHVLAMGEDVNILVVDTEMYSNTGGQSSKATPLGAAAQFQSSGKKSRKKDLGALCMTYGNVYVAQVAMGADPAQLMKALTEADAYPGPSIIIAYTPCVSHGIKMGMNNAQAEARRAVEAGYWHLYRYNPLNKERPFTLDSKEPKLDFREFLKGEVRYASLEISFPENARELFAQAERDAREKYLGYVRLQEKKA